MTYAAIITEATGITNEADVAETENTIRDEYPILGGLTRAKLIVEARKAWSLVQYLRSDAGIAEMARYEAAYA